MALVEAIGVVSGVLGIFSFFQDQFNTDTGGSNIGYTLKVGLDGANGDLDNAGGNIPDIRAYNEHGELLGTTVNDNSYCGSGYDNCQTQVDNVYQQPTYTLFSANNDAMCIAYVSVTFPGKDKYAWVGNWGQQCGVPWYYSDIYVQNDKGSDKVLCTWVDGNGDQPTTGFSLHWPEYRKGYAGNGNTPDYYCNNAPPLDFRTDHDPNYIVYYSRKRDMLSASPSVAMSPAHTIKRDNKDEYLQRVKRSQSNDSRLVKSKSADHTASGLCNSKTSVGPSLVSMDERRFCHMETKTLYPFCEDVESGHCWSDDVDNVITKGGATQRLAAAPSLNFSKTMKWGEDN